MWELQAPDHSNPEAPQIMPSQAPGIDQVHSTWQEVHGARDVPDNSPKDAQTQDQVPGVWDMPEKTPLARYLGRGEQCLVRGMNLETPPAFIKKGT